MAAGLFEDMPFRKDLANVYIFHQHIAKTGRFQNNSEKWKKR